MANVGSALLCSRRDSFSAVVSNSRGRALLDLSEWKLKDREPFLGLEPLSTAAISDEAARVLSLKMKWRLSFLGHSRNGTIVVCEYAPAR